MGAVTGDNGDALEQPPDEPQAPGFGERGRMRRRVRFLRKARELAYRDLGGLVFDLHRFGQRNDPVVSAKLATLNQIDAELRALEDALHKHQPVTVLREVGIGACPRCAAIHGRNDRFCPGCGLPFDAKAERPLATAPSASPLATAPSASSPVSAPSPVSASSPVPKSAPESDSQPVKGTPPAQETPPTKDSPPAKDTAPPVAAQAASRRDKDEPTQILQPPVRGT